MLSFSGTEDSVVLSEFLTELPALPTEPDMVEEESQRRSQRKRVEKFDPDDEAFGPRKKRPKVTEQGTTVVADEKLPKNKRADSPFEEPVVTEADKARSKYEECVVHLVPSQDEFEEDEVLMPFLRLAELWLRWLELLRRRLSEVEALNGEINRSLERVKAGDFASKEGRAEFDGLVLRFRSWSQKRSIITSRVTEWSLINDKLTYWTQEAETILSRHQLKTVDELRDFIKIGEGANVFLPQLDVLRAQHKRSKTWISKFQRLTSSGKTPSNAELEELSTESEQLPVNLDEYTSLISLDTKKYCICRQSYHSEMIGCDECDEWYHLQCVGLSQAQADKLERYLCIRCTLRQSFCNAAMLAAQSVNKWMTPLDVLRSREQRLNKVSKRVAKEEKEMERIQTELSKLVQLGKQRQEAEIARLGSDHPAVSMFGAQPPTTEEAEQYSLLALLSQNNEITAAIRKYTNEYEVLKQSLKRNQAEEKEVQAIIELEHSHSSDISEWMQSLKVILWPSSPETLNLGAPLPTGELPIGVKRVAVEAERLGISKVEDVVYVLQCFLWMGWCYRCSMSIRGPISTNELRRLVNASRSIKFYDDRIVKILVGILTRAKYDTLFYT